MAPWPIITGSRLDNWLYWRLLLKALLITINYSAIANLPSSQITRTRSIFVLVLRCAPSILILFSVSQFCTSVTAASELVSYNHFARIPRKTACSPRRWLSIYLLLFRAFASAGMCLATRYPATGMARTTHKTLLAHTVPTVACAHCDCLETCLLVTIVKSLKILSHDSGIQKRFETCTSKCKSEE
jgi:hypothetical protein